MSRRKKWLIIGGSLAGALVIAVFVTARVVSQRIEPYIHQQAVEYLSQRFDSDVELAALRVQLPKASSLRILLTRGRGAVASVEGDGISLRRHGQASAVPLLSMQKFRFHVDIHGLFEEPKVIPLVVIDGLRINVPPKEQRAASTKGPSARKTAPPAQKELSPQPKTSVLIEQVQIRDAVLTILPKESNKVPLQFDIHEVRMESVGKDVAMKYQASLTNAKPPGEIESKGTFGPWQAGEPSDTPLAGDYVFNNADLSVFQGIAGVLQSTGNFEGTLSEIHARGEANVPDFRLKSAGNRVPLRTKFEVLVDGTNGNTILKPVMARLGSTDFTTSGGVIKHEHDQRRTIQLDVSMPKGNLADLLRLAVKGSPFMEGQIALKTSIDIPPLTGKVRQKLNLDGSFDVYEGKFLKSTIQDQLDGLSRKAQGQPKNEAIDEVVADMRGKFKLDDEVVTFESLSFRVPGARVKLAGAYALDKDALDFHGTLALRARVSETQTGWKRWALKPVDPFFSKQGAGTFLHIKVDGTAKEPKFGLDRGWKDREKAVPAAE